jgi:DNA-binding NarL/FixJ family response regulator
LWPVRTCRKQHEGGVMTDSVVEVRVAVNASDSITRVGLTSQLASRTEITVVPYARPVDADVLVLAANVISMEIINSLRAITGESEVRIVLLTDQLDEMDLLSVVECRVVAVLPRGTATGDQVANAALAAMNGGAVLPPDLLGALLEQVKLLRREARPMNCLSPREIEILRLLAEGCGTAEIARKLCYSERTVKNVLHALLSRLNLRNRPHAVAYAVRSGLI